MASYNELNALIDAYINQNGVQAITGQILNGVLKAMVEQLGRGYAIMGAADPTTDPGTPDAPECYFASETGTYTDFDGLQVVPGELALLCYTPSDGWTKNTIYEGFRTVGATIDGNVGTPSVGVAYANGVLSFDFHNMKGNTGDPAGFGTIGATVDGNIGTPSVSVQSSGPDTAKNLTFAFTNLKGETGVTSVVSTVDNTSGNPSCTVSLVGQQLTLAFSGLKGAQGDTGVSADYPIAIVNNLTTDDPASALSAAQGVVLEGEVSQLRQEVNGVTTTVETQVDLTALEQIAAYIYNDVWGNNANVITVLAPVNPGETYVLVAPNDKDGIFAILKNDIHTSGHSADYADGYTTTIRVSVGTRQTVTIPADGHYVYVYLKSQYGTIDSTLYRQTTTTTGGLAGDVAALQGGVAQEILDRTAGDSALQEQIDDIMDELTDVVDVDLSELEHENWIINKNSGEWSILSPSQSVLVPVTPGMKYTVSNVLSSVIAWLKSDNRALETVPDYCLDSGGRIALEAGSTTEYTAPSDSVYLFVLVTNSAGNDLGISVSYVSYKDVCAPDNSDSLITLAAAIGNALRPLSFDLDGNGAEIPQTLQVLNVQRMARQMTAIEWTALGDISQGSPVSFDNGDEVTGLPYSSVKELDKYIGDDVSIHTFMTAVNNPYSLLYTENVNANHSRSAWGKTYHGVNACGPYFGVVCSSLTSLCTGMLAQYPTATDAWLRNKAHKFVRIFDQSAQGLMIGDIVWIPGHNRLVTGLKRDSSGNVTYVRTAEAIAPSIVQGGYITASAFDTKLANEGGILYRNIELYKNINYTPSDFVAGDDDETITAYTYNDVICCFAGDKATFREGDTIAVDYNLKEVGVWTEMELYKDDVLVDTITIDSSVHFVDLTSRNLAYGKYKARMKNGTDYSDYTYWEILQTDVTISITDKVSTIGMTSANGIPLTITVCDIAGTIRAFRELTEDEISDMYAEIDLYALNEEQYPSNPISGSSLYVKIHFQGDYGRVTNEPIAVNF